MGEDLATLQITEFFLTSEPTVGGNYGVVVDRADDGVPRASILWR